MSDITQRKEDHLDLAARGEVGFRRTSTLFECVRLVHNALPELDFGAIDTSALVLGKRLRAPILIAGMTGGSERAGRINRELGRIAEARGYALGLGSQRAMLVNPEATATYCVRDVAPSTLLLGNIGVVQARESTDATLEALVSRTGVDALCVHMNPAQELVQIDGDRDFRGGATRMAELVGRMPVPVVAKETGCGLSAWVGRQLRAAGVEHVDVSGAGGTSWVGVETARAPESRKSLGEAFWDWGIPTAASVALTASQGFTTVFATGGVASGLDVAKAIALGASAAGIARPVLQALESGGREAVLSLLDQIELELRTAMLLVGAADLAALRRVPRVILGELGEWLRQAGSG